jgi:hypothetical protein
MSKTTSELIHELAQECITHTPVIILGSGASAAYGIPGMPELRDHLLSLDLPKTATTEDRDAWGRFVSRLTDTDLETALNDVRLSEWLTEFVVVSTWDFLAPYDIKVFEDMLANQSIFPLTKLYRHLFKSTRNDIHVITPNYDRIAEYAADAANVPHYSGFTNGHVRSRVTGTVPKLFFGKIQARTVNVWKVHGSFDWFRDRDGIVIALPIRMNRPHNLHPVIVTPGIEKYRLTHDEPFHSIKTEADRALQSAESYLCIGYGFNDTHLQTTLVERCRVKSVPLVLFTKKISSTAHAFLRSGKCGRYLAIEAKDNGCRVYSTETPDGVDLADKLLWRLDQFLTLIM